MSLITEKYPYQEIKRRNVDGSRKYLVGDTPLPSVTTILDITSDKTHLNEWRDRVGHEKANQITREAASRGTSMHKYLEDYVETGEWPKAKGNLVHQQSYSMAEKIRDEALKHVDQIWGSEVALYFPGIYAGTTDLVGTYKGTPCIMDFKQANRKKKEEWVENYYLQLAAYANAHNELYGTVIRWGHIFMCTKDGEFQHFTINPHDFNKWSDMWWERCELYYQALQGK